jgi:Yip1 domain
LRRLIGVVRSPRETLAAAGSQPRSLDLAVLIVLISAACSVGFLMTRVGRLAALDQQVRQLESLGIVVDDQLYSQVRQWQRYRPALSAAGILVGWPGGWALTAALIQTIGKRRRMEPSPTSVSFAQVFSVIVHASSVLAVRSIVALPLNYMNESIGGNTSLGALIPGLGSSSFVARLFGAVDLFVLWWFLLVALGLGILYRVRPLSIARWLLGAYATGAAALALTQALRGGV